MPLELVVGLLYCSSSNLLLDILSTFKGLIYNIKLILIGGIVDKSLDMVLPVELESQNVTKKLVMMRVKAFVPDMLVRSV